MSIKTILLHLADHDDQMEKRLNVATSLALAHDAHLTAIFIPTPQVRRGIGRGASSPYVNNLEKAALEKADGVKELFEKACKKAKISSQFVIEEDGEDYNVLETHARAADLMVVSQPCRETFEDRFRDMLPEELVIVSGVPVMMVPISWQEKPIGKHVMIAWRSTREGVRAVRDSLDLLKAAEKITLLTVGSSEETGRLPIEQVQTYLSRHGVEAEIRRDFDERTDVGKVIRAQADDLGADMIVMGGYGEKGIFKKIVGTVTKSMTRGSKIPIVLSH